MSTQTIDPLLGADYQSELIDLPADDEGPVQVALVQKRWPKKPPLNPPKNPVPNGTQTNKTPALLYVHGFNDYFFNTETAEWAERLGFHFYALDLRKYGRARAPRQSPCYCLHIDEYFADYDAVFERIRKRDGHEHVVILAHSTGGLSAVLWAHARRRQNLVQGLILNAPFLAVGHTRIDTWKFQLAARAARFLDPKRPIVERGQPHYHWSLHQDFAKGGEWNYDLSLKTPGTVQVRLGWIAAVVAAQAQVQKGLDVSCPIQVVVSSLGGGPAQWGPHWFNSDMVLPVDRIVRLAPRLGDIVKVEQIPGAMHDVLLSRPSVRADAYNRMESWLAATGLLAERSI